MMEWSRSEYKEFNKHFVSECFTMAMDNISARDLQMLWSTVQSVPLRALPKNISMYDLLDDLGKQQQCIPYRRRYQ